jgi:hypothetical protein
VEKGGNGQLQNRCGERIPQVKDPYSAFPDRPYVRQPRSARATSRVDCLRATSVTLLNAHAVGWSASGTRQRTSRSRSGGKASGHELDTK